MTTLAKMKLLEADEPELREARYRRLRATCVLASASNTVKQMQDRKLDKALATMRKQNFDMERVKPNLIEYIYATFDEKLTDKITDEFRFVPKWTNVKDNGSCVAYCDLCGKGDSLEHRENRDKLRYTFRLQNGAGGEDVWVGSTCIMQHGLHVDGARTAEEAERLLKKAFNQAKLQWEIEQWRADNQDHFEIPELWERFRSVRFYTFHEEYYAKFGIKRKEMMTAWYRLMGKSRDGSRNHFKGAYRQYTSRGALTKGKHVAWVETKRMMGILKVLFPIFLKAREMDPNGWNRFAHPDPKALDFLDEEAKKLKRRKSWRALIAPPESVVERKRQPRKVTKRRKPRRIRR